jgi:hypothetical protein
MASEGTLSIWAGVTDGLVSGWLGSVAQAEHVKTKSVHKMNRFLGIWKNSLIKQMFTIRLNLTDFPDIVKRKNFS